MNFVRIPDLPIPTPYVGILSLNDKVPYWIYENNKTVWVDMALLKGVLQTGSGGTLPNVSSGGKILYIVPVEDEDEDTFGMSAIAGKDFNLTLEGRPLIKQIYDAGGNPTVTGAEYEVLAGGGFRRVDGDTFIPGQRYELALFQTAGTTPTGTGAALFTGIFQADTNTPLDATHLNKAIQIRNGSTITLWDIADTPDYLPVLLEADINNSVQPTVQTRNGQFIYINNVAVTWLTLGFGEVLWLLRKSDGYYVINDFGACYEAVGTVAMRYKAGLNELILNGQEVSRTVYKRLWAYVQTLGYSFIDEAAWQIGSQTDSMGNFVENPYRGCFSNGNGSTTFRLPDLRNQFIRGLHADGAERFYNHAGGRQDDQMKEHFHPSGTKPLGGPDYSLGPAHQFTYWQTTEGTGTGNVSTGKTGGTETRPKNVGLLYVIKA